ncbi:hypothetical protein FA15DRAFT_357972 [Coprinopsis marcescibilis]|uniref:Nephrocystin 3-like N-terminal domain-containing protein n=1 Tax=Coprinopsis marcescibilis TaxID=230819 RepID=A0A5C3KXR8_COPMA|nr:hypothetical protein FA15DRAFT_357972 [Coprinopsis marcescibilis]
MHKFKLLHKTVKKWKSSSEENVGMGREGRSTGASVLTGASNVTLRDYSQVNVVEGNQTNITNINTDAEINEALRRLPDPVGCSWNPSRACLEGTRILHIQEVERWEAAPNLTSAGVYVVAEPVGSGKSSLAHTISKNAHKEGNLVAAFFFDQGNHYSNPSNMMAAFLHGLCEVNEAVKHQIGNVLAKDKNLAKADPVRQFEEIIIPICPILPQDRRFVVVIDALDEEQEPVVVQILRDWVPRLPPSFRIFVTTRPEARIMEQLEKQSHIQFSSNPLTGPTNKADIALSLNCWFSKAKYGGSISPELLDDFIDKSEGLFLWATVVLHHIGTSFSPAEELKEILTGSSDHWNEADGAVKQLDSLYERILSKLKLGTDRRFMKKYRTIMGALVMLREPLSVTGLAALYAPDGITLDDIHRICGLLRPLLRNHSEDDLQSPIHLVHLSVNEYLTGRAPSEYRLNYEEHHSTLSRLCLHTIKNHLSPQNVPILGYSDGEWFRDITQTPPTVPQLSKEDVTEQIWYACKHVEAHTFESSSNVDGAHARLALDVFVQEPRSLLEATLSEATLSMGDVIDIIWLKDMALAMAHAPSIDSTLKRKTAAIYSSLGRSVARQTLSDIPMKKIKKAAVSLYRELHSEAKEDTALAEEFAVALYTLCEAKHYDGFQIYGARTAEEVLEDVRPISGMISRPLLSKILRISSLMISKSIPQGRDYDELALKLAQEDIQISRQLAADNAAKFEKHLELSLSNFHQVCVALKRIEDAIPPIAEAIQICRKLASKDPAGVGGALPSYIEGFLSLLSTAGRHADAVEQAQELVLIRRSSSFGEEQQLNLGLMLDTMAYELFKCGRTTEGIAASVESVAVFRQVAARYEAFWQLRYALHRHGAYLTLVGRPLEAMVAKQEAVAIYRQEKGALRRTDRQDGDLAESLLDFAEYLRTWKRHVSETPTAYLDAIDAFRHLAQTNPEIYEPKVAYSISRYAVFLSGAARYHESLEEARKAVGMHHRLALKDPNSFRERFGEWMSAMIDPISTCSHGTHDQAHILMYVTGLIELHRNAASMHPEIDRARFATHLRELSFSHERNGSAPAAFRLEAIKEAVSIRRQLAEQDNSPSARDELASALNTYAWYLTQMTGPFDDAIRHAKEVATIYRRSYVQDPNNRYVRLILANTLDTLAHALNLGQQYSDAVTAAEEGLRICQKLAKEEGNQAGNPANILHRRSADALLNLGRNAEALPHIQEAVALSRVLANRVEYPAEYTEICQRELTECLLLLDKITSNLAAST